MKNELAKAGLRVGEITGRNLIDYYSGDEPVLREPGQQETSIRGRRATITAFNNGELDVMVLNQAGATGLSLHAGEKFKDQRQRHMMIVQAEANIDTHMQMLGRVHRTGQVVVPTYSQLVADIPAEKRPAAVLAKKMASLNANTTASRTGALTAESVVDFINDYGDMVAVTYIADDPIMNMRLGQPIKMKESGGYEREDAMRKLTGRIPLLPLKDQEALYEHLEAEYDALLKQMDAAGENALEAKTLDMQARTLATAEVVPAKGNSPSPFAAPVTMTKVSARRLGKPFASDELVRRVAEAMNEDAGEVTKENAARLLSGLAELSDNKTYFQEHRTAFDAYKRGILDDMEGPAQENERTRLDATQDRFIQLTDVLKPAARVTLKTSNGNLAGVVLKVERKGKTKNPLALSGWKANIAIANASRQLVVPLSRLWPDGKSSSDDDYAIEVAPVQDWLETYQQTLDRFEHMQGDTREERFIATGNLLAAFEWLNHKGRIVHYTDAEGAVRQGILTAHDFKFTEHAAAKGRVMKDAKEVRAWLAKRPGTSLESTDGNVLLTDNRGNATISVVRAKNRGGVYYLDKNLTDTVGDFASRGGRMVAYARESDLLPAIERLQQLGATFTEQVDAPKLQEAPTTLASVARADTLTPKARQRQADLEHMLTTLIQRLVGRDVRVKFSPGNTIDYKGKLEGWGGYAEGKNVLGGYTPAERLISLALGSKGVTTTAFHEALHDIEAHLWSQRELELMIRETGRLRDIVQKRYGFSDDDISKVVGYEIRAMAFEAYAEERERGGSGVGYGLHIGIRRAFERLLKLLRAIRNGLSRMGFQTAEDIFGKAYRGEFASRPSRHEAPLSSVKEAARVGDNLRERIAERFAPSNSKFVERVQDLSRPVRELQTELEARRFGTFPDSQDFYVKKRLFPGMRASSVEEFNKDLLDPLVAQMRKDNIALPDAALYLYARHAAERNAAMDKINPDLGGSGSGMTDEQAQSVLDRVEREGKAAAYEKVARRVADIREFILDTMQRGGLEKPEVITAWREQYTDYVPLRGFEDAPEEAPGEYRAPAGFTVRGKEVQPAFGRRSRADNPLVNLIDQAYRTIDRAERNRYLQSFDLAMNSLDPADAADIATRNRGKPKREIDPNTGLVRTVDTLPNVLAPNVVSLKIGGNPVHWVFKNPDTAQAIRRMSPDALSGIAQSLLTVQNKLKAIWTHYSPDFLARHFLARYPIEGTLNSFEQKEGGKHSVGRYIADAVPFLGHASRAIFARNKGQDAGEYGRYWDEMRAHGGAMTFRSMRDMDLLREHLNTQLMSLKGRPIATVRQRWRKTIEAMDTVTNALDNSLRLAAYVSARKQGKTPQQAALIAREATVDFQLKGKWSNAIGLWFPFGNVAIQTAARMTKAVARSRTMRRVFMGTMLAGFLTAMFNYLVGGNDKDGVPFFDKLPEWDKRLNFIVLNPFDRDDKGRPMPEKIPMPYNWALPLAMGYAFGNMVFGSESAQKSISLITHALLESLTPFGAEHDKAVLLAPELARPFLHVALNEKFQEVRAARFLPRGLRRGSRLRRRHADQVRPRGDRHGIVASQGRDAAKHQNSARSRVPRHRLRRCRSLPRLRARPSQAQALARATLNITQKWRPTCGR
jgi:hypothetical protein